ncbi:MAG: hypothetical protein ABIJ96_12255 [Elusimicrobiota bacterium]
MGRFRILCGALTALILSIQPLCAEIPGAQAGTRQDPNAVLGIFEGEDAVLFWHLRDAGFSAKSVSEYLRTAKMGSKNVGSMLDGLRAGWLILRDPARDAAHYTFYDPKTEGVYYVPISATIEYGEAKLARSALEVRDDGLMAAYGDPRTGAVVVRRLSPDLEAIESTAGILEHEKGVLKEALILEPSAFGMLLEHPALQGIAAKLNEQTENKSSAAAEMAAYLRGGKNRSILATRTGSGDFLFKLRDDGHDKRYIYTSPDSIREFPVG